MISAVNAVYGLAVAWVYIAAFVLALGMVFIFPPGTLLVFFIGLASLGLAVALGKLIDAITRGMARRSMASGRCPRCRDLLTHAGERGDERPVVCALCGSAFLDDGGETIASEQSHFIDKPDDDEPDVMADAGLARR